MKTIQVEGWTIERNLKPIPNRSFDIDFYHADHDGDNGLCGTASNLKDALEQIAEIEADHDREFRFSVCVKCFDYYSGNSCPVCES